MDNEHLFTMLDECIDYAKETLCTSQNLDSFAMVLEPNNDIRSLHLEHSDDTARYDTLLQMLRNEAKEEKITAIASM
jgi:hypothetical protein